MPPTIRTNNGIEIPQVGFGVYQILASRTTEMVRVALNASYRHVDTAQVYGNEAEIGTAIVESGLPREDVFITTKLNPQHQLLDFYGCRSDGFVYCITVSKHTRNKSSYSKPY